jgi:hypothetical protein
MKALNAGQWKTMLPYSVKDGSIYQDDLIEVTCVI